MRRNITWHLGRDRFGLGEVEQDLRPSMSLNFNMYYRAWTELERDKSWSDTFYKDEA